MDNARESYAKETPGTGLRSIAYNQPSSLLDDEEREGSSLPTRRLLLLVFCATGVLLQALLNPMMAMHALSSRLFSAELSEGALAKRRAAEAEGCVLHGFGGQLAAFCIGFGVNLLRSASSWGLLLCSEEIEGDLRDAAGHLAPCENA